MDSLASGFESGPAHKTDEYMRRGDGLIHGAGKKKRRLSKKERKKSSTYGKQVRYIFLMVIGFQYLYAICNLYIMNKNLFQPPVGVVEPRTILSHLDNALDIAEFHKGQGAILQKVSVVTKPKNKLGE